MKYDAIDADERGRIAIQEMRSFSLEDFERALDETDAPLSDRTLYDVQADLEREHARVVERERFAPQVPVMVMPGQPTPEPTLQSEDLEARIEAIRARRKRETT